MSNQATKPYPTPPEPPELPRQIDVPTLQIVGVILLLILPVLAVIGVFGESFGAVDASGSDISLSANYPSRLRYGLDSSLQITVENTGQQALDTVLVHFERDYIDQFSNVSFAPSVTEATRSAYVVGLHDLAPGANQTITVQLQGDRYGRHGGRVWITLDDRTAAELTLSSIVFP